MTDIYGAPSGIPVAITPSDATEINFRAFFVGGNGNIAIIGRDDKTNTAVTLNGVVAGAIYPISVKKVMSTNTTATGIVGLV